MHTTKFVCLVAVVTVIRCTASSHAFGAGDPQFFDPSAKAVDTVVVTASRISSPIGEIPAAVTVIEKDEIQSAQPTVTLRESLVGVPGVFVQNDTNFAQDVRISIRGFGSRSAFGIRGIQIYVDGIPQTLPDGQSQVDTIDMGEVQRIEVMRGPVSALYGNSSGGVINITTEDGPENPFAELRTVGGEFGLWKMQARGGGQSGRANYLLNVSHVQVSGYRDHSRAESWRWNGKVRFDLAENSDITLLLNSVYSPELEDPGGLTEEQARTDPAQASPLSLQFDTREKVGDARGGLVYRNELNEHHQIEAAGYYSYRTLDNAIPFRFVELGRDVLGGRIQYELRGSLFRLAHQVLAGTEVQYQNDDRRNFDNVDGRAGPVLLLDQREEVTNVGVYVQERLKLSERWSAVLGGRYDNVRFSIHDHLTTDGDDTGSKTFDQATGRVGLIYGLMPSIDIYAGIAQAFETPTTTELVNQPLGGGGINSDLEPQKSVNLRARRKRRTCRANQFRVSIVLHEPARRTDRVPRRHGPSILPKRG